MIKTAYIENNNVLLRGDQSKFKLQNISNLSKIENSTNTFKWTDYRFEADLNKTRKKFLFRRYESMNLKTVRFCPDFFNLCDGYNEETTLDIINFFIEKVILKDEIKTG